MDLLQLETFSHLVIQGSFIRAAKELGVSQPTVTIRIKMLEEELGLPLILRVGNKIKLTPAGQTFYEHVERSIRVLKEGVEQCSKERQKQQTRLAVAGTPHLCTYVIPKVMGHTYRTNPEWELTLTTGRSWEVTQMILDEVCDVGFINGFYKHHDVETISLFQDPFYLMAHPSHPLVQREAITLYDLSEESIFTYKLESNMSYMIKNLFRDIKIRTDILMELNDSYTMKRMILEGNGIGFMPWSGAEQDVQMGRLSVLPIELPTPLVREVNLVVLKKRLEHEEISEFITHLSNIYVFKLQES